ncbi:MAG: MFS transporter [Chloroflexi bacterium]|nr:MFS transporter [Chloroflexota bacterium]
MIQAQRKLHTFFGVSFLLIGIVFSTRFVIDISTRMLFTFVPQLTGGLRMTLIGFGWLMFLRAIVGVTGPIFGAASDRHGRRRVMAFALLVQAVAMTGLAFSQGWWAVIPMVLSGLSLAAFVPAQQAYASEQAPPHKRGRVMGAVELSWSCTAIFATPLVGWLINVLGWRAPLLILGLLSLLGTAVVLQLPAVPLRQSLAQRQNWAQTRQQLVRKNILATVLVAFLVYVAVTCYLTIAGVWLAADFGLNAAVIGSVFVAIGFAELAGAGASSLLIDRIGKRRGNVLGLILLALAFAIFSILPQILSLAVFFLAAMGLLFQFTIVSLLPLYAEQSVAARGTVLALVFAGVGLGAALGPPLTAMLWERYHAVGVSVIGVACTLLAVGLVWRFLRETAVSVPNLG